MQLSMRYQRNDNDVEYQMLANLGAQLMKKGWASSLKLFFFHLHIYYCQLLLLSQHPFEIYLECLIFSTMGTAKTVLGCFFLLQALSPVKSQECNLCMGGLDTIPDAYLMRPALHGKTCQNLGFEAMYYNANDDNCLRHLHLVGYTICGCEPPPSPPIHSCSLCMDGRAPPDLHSFFDDDLSTCGFIHRFLQLFPQNPETCHSFHLRGIEKCGCPDLLPRDDSMFQSDSTLLFDDPTSSSPSTLRSPTSETSDAPSSRPILLPPKRKSRKKPETTELSSYQDSLVLVLGVGSMLIIFTLFYCITRNRTFDENDVGSINKVDIISDTSSDQLSNEETLTDREKVLIPAAILLPVNFESSEHALLMEESSTDSSSSYPSEFEKCTSIKQEMRAASRSQSRANKKISIPYSQYFD